MNTGAKIHHLRVKAKLTLQELGDKVGVGASTVRKWETGQISTIRSDKISKLAQALETTPAYLMDWTESSISIETNQGVVGANSGGIHIGVDTKSKEEEELVRIFNSLGVKDRTKLLNYAWSLEEDE